MLSLFTNIKQGLERANQFKTFISLLFFCISYIFIPDTQLYVANGMVYAILPQIIKVAKKKLIIKYHKSDILSYKTIFFEYSYKIIDLACYAGVIENYNNMYSHVPHQAIPLMYIWHAFIEMHRYRYYCEVFISSILIISCVIFYPFFKSSYKKYEIIINNLTKVPLSVYRNVCNAITEGQSLDLRIDNLVIISIPPKYKVHISEDELENIAPKIMPNNISMSTRRMTLEQNNCAICQDTINISKEMSRTLPKCKHSFHCHCIDNWFFSGHNICPICRDEIKRRD